MAYDAYLGERIRQIISTKNVPFYKKKNDGWLGLYGK